MPGKPNSLFTPILSNNYGVSYYLIL